MKTLKTATGKEYYCSFMIKSNKQNLYMKLLIDPNEALDVFRNPEETKELQWLDEQGNITLEAEHFTKFVELFLEDGPCPVRIRLDLDLDALIWDRFEEIEQIKQAHQNAQEET